MLGCAVDRDEERRLIAATTAFRDERVAVSWWCVLSTFVLLLLFGAAAALAPVAWPFRLALGVATGLVFVRAFVLYHDYMHESLLRGSILGAVLFRFFGLVAVTPPRVWAATHNYHHSHTGRIQGSHIGSYHLVTVEMWRSMTARARLAYRLTRHPLTILFGYLTAFVLGMCVSSFVRNPKRHWDSGLSLVVHVAASAAVWVFLGWQAYLFAWVTPFVVGSATGAYLFYVQHNFPDTRIPPHGQWTYAGSALESSCYMRSGPFWEWITANIGYHHVHHLNPAIPFYRLPEAMAAVPELQHPPETTLWPRDIIAAFRQKLWDPAQNRMVGYPA